MTISEKVFLILLILNCIVSFAYLIWWLVFKKDTDNRKQYLMNTVVMLLCPIVGIMYFLFSYLKYRFVKFGKRDLSDVDSSPVDMILQIITKYSSCICDIHMI